MVVAKLDALLVEARAVDLHARAERRGGELRRRGDGEGEPRVLAGGGQSKWLRGGRHRSSRPAPSSCTVPATRARAAVSSTVTGRAAPGANSCTPAMNRSETGGMTSSRRRIAGVRGIRGRHRLAGDHQRLPADFEDVLERERGRVLGRGR